MMARSFLARGKPAPFCISAPAGPAGAPRAAGWGGGGGRTNLTMTTATAWQVRILDYDAAVPLDQLLAHPSNPKIHPTAQTDALKGILGEVGWVTGLIVNQRTGYLLDGHDRVKAAMQAGQTTAPVFYVDVPPDQEAYVLATFDPVGALAATDSAALDALLRDVQSGDAAVQALLAETARAAGLYLDTPPNVQFKEYDESVADDVKYATCPECGHRFPA